MKSFGYLSYVGRVRPVLQILGLIFVLVVIAIIAIENLPISSTSCEGRSVEVLRIADTQQILKWNTRIVVKSGVYEPTLVQPDDIDYREISTVDCLREEGNVYIVFNATDDSMQVTYKINIRGGELTVLSSQMIHKEVATATSFHA